MRKSNREQRFLQVYSLSCFYGSKHFVFLREPSWQEISNSKQCESSSPHGWYMLISCRKSKNGGEASCLYEVIAGDGGRCFYFGQCFCFLFSLPNMCLSLTRVVAVMLCHWQSSCAKCACASRGRQDTFVVCGTHPVGAACLVFGGHTRWSVPCPLCDASRGIRSGRLLGCGMTLRDVFCVPRCRPRFVSSVRRPVPNSRPSFPPLFRLRIVSHGWLCGCIWRGRRNRNLCEGAAGIRANVLTGL